MNETVSLSDEIDRQIRAGWMSFKRYKQELYDRPKASLLPLKARMVKDEVVEALLYGCATWTPLKGHYAKLRTTHHRSLLQPCSRWSFVDVPLIFFCSADHVSDWQPRILLGMVEARSVDVKKTTTTDTCSTVSLFLTHY